MPTPSKTDIYKHSGRWWVRPARGGVYNFTHFGDACLFARAFGR